ncbi:hypothetical protein K9M79_05690 [Candidatus Woesearchaeota archaeon]|nr:hypothetical protein [Candidatus Woesearchaeota archaeon]
MRNSQVSFFIIIGLLLVVILCLAFILFDNYSISATTEVSPVSYYISSCLQSVSEEAVWYMGIVGGELNPTEFIIVGNNNITVYRKKPVNTEYYLNSMIKSRVLDCIDHNQITKMGFKIFNSSDIVINSYVFNKTVQIRMEYSISLESVDSIIRLDNFMTSIDVPLGTFIEFGSSIARKIGAYDISTDCGEYDIDGLTNVYITDHNSTHKLVKIINYKTYYDKYHRSFVFNFGVENAQLLGNCA